MKTLEEIRSIAEHVRCAVHKLSAVTAPTQNTLVHMQHQANQLAQWAICLEICERLERLTEAVEKLNTR